jgi:hypothetical protein
MGSAGAVGRSSAMGWQRDGAVLLWCRRGFGTGRDQKILRRCGRIGYGFVIVKGTMAIGVGERAIVGLSGVDAEKYLIE